MSHLLEQRWMVTCNPYRLRGVSLSRFRVFANLTLSWTQEEADSACANFKHYFFIIWANTIKLCAFIRIHLGTIWRVKLLFTEINVTMTTKFWRQFCRKWNIPVDTVIFQNGLYSKIQCWKHGLTAYLWK